MGGRVIPILSVVGRSNTGKTTFIEKLIPVLKAKGIRVATIKHHLHDFEYFVAAGWLVHKLITKTPLNRKIHARMSVLQYVVMQMFLVIMLSLPVKILARQLFRIKYVWVTPWFNI